MHKTSTPFEHYVKKTWLAITEPVSGIVSTSRTASGTPKLPALDGLRAIAMLMVFIFHAWEYAGKHSWVVSGLPVGNVLSHFNLGVDLFIILSGFCLYWPVLHHPERFKPKQWFIRRFWRIGPAYYVSILFIVLAPVLANVLMKQLNMPAIADPPLSFLQLVSHLTFTHSFHPTTLFGIQGVYWSLGVEAQLYLLFPLALKLVNRFGIFVTVALMAFISVCWHLSWPTLLPQQWHMVGEFSVLERLFQFGFGMAIAAYHHKQERILHWSLYPVAACLLILSQATFVTSSVLPLEIVFATIALALLVALLVKPHPFASFMKTKSLVFLGTISYSMYLLHQRITWGIGGTVKAVLKLPDTYSFVICMVVALPIVIVISTIFYILVERRFAQGIHRKNIDVTNASSRA
jgi:peptidoglycan/LPS O-acetylase OafA/YrhL